MNTIKINNAYLHNLKNIDISIPKNKLVTATGVSGSGKTTVFFDILFQKGRKRYLESLGMITPICDGFSLLESLISFFLIFMIV
jgi:excinuclease UvrABC ATPase subunit